MQFAPESVAQNPPDALLAKHDKVVPRRFAMGQTAGDVEMNFSRFQPKRSLKTRVTLFTLAIFVLSIWALTFFASRMLQGDMQHLLGEQQFSTVSVIAQNVNDRLADRLRAVESMAAQIDANLLDHAAALQTRLEERPILSIMFNAGAFVTGIDGTAIASVPVSTRRIGVSYLDRDFIVAALNEGRSSIGRPVIGKQLKSALILVAAPIRDRQGKVIGALAGVTDLGQPNFLDEITENRYGENGGYLLNAPKERLIITATDKTRIMQPLPPPGVNRMLDRYIEGYEGYGLSVNSRGVEELTSAKGIAVAGWFMGVVMPAADAFAPIYDMQRRMLLASLSLTLLAGLLTWWMLKRQLAPLIATADAMVDLSSKNQIPQPLSVSSQDEVGQLTSGFNRLVETWIQREGTLRESEERYRTLIEWSPQALAVHRGKEILYVNPAAIKLFGAGCEQDLVGKSIFDRVHPDFRERVLDLFKSDASRDSIFPLRQTKLLKLDGSTMDVESQSTLIVYDGVQARQIVLRDVTEQKRIAAQVAASESRMRAVFDAALDAVISMDSAGRITSWNGRAEAIFGWRCDEVVGLMLHETITPQQHRTALQEGLVRFLATGRGKMLNRRVQLVALRRNGEEFPVELSILTFKEDGAYYFTAFVADITERKAAEETQRIAATAFNSQQGMCITDADKVILRVNMAFTKITGYSAEEVVGKTPRVLKSGRHDAAFYAVMWESVIRTGQWHGEIWNRRKNGTLYPQMLHISCVRNEDGVVTHYVGSFRDISSAKAAEEQIESLAFSDLLTGLPNRRMLIIALQQAMIAGEREKRQGALLLVDLDHFKNLNDALGHEQGDLLLQQFAKRLSASVREGETVSRLGGDEFVVLLMQLDPNPLEAAMHAETTARKLLDALRQPYVLDGAEISCSASIGITLFGAQQEDTVEPLKRAELAMYEAKARGRNTLRFFDPEMQAAVNSRVVMEAALREAIATSQFLLHYQAQVTEQGQITGVEALLRWPDPKRGMVSPAEFIPVAEETGLILPIGDWVLESACRQLRQWASQPEMAHLTIAVNVSARQFHQRDFVDHVLGKLERTGANPSRLKLELTESLLISNVADVIAKMDVLKARGVGFSLDDFGTGYSSLTYLKRLPLDQLKIDQSFVRDILIDSDDAAIARTVVALADSLGLAVIAEGVETEAQRQFLAGLGCRNYQGYLFSRPLPVAEFEALVTQV